RTGEMRRACFLNVQGRVRLDALLVSGFAVDLRVFGRRHTLGMEFGSPAGSVPTFRLIANAEAAAKATPELERFVIADDVTVSKAGQPSEQLWLIGPRAVQVLGAEGTAVESGRGEGLAIDDQPVLAHRRDLGARTGFRLG